MANLGGKITLDISEADRATAQYINDFGRKKEGAY